MILIDDASPRWIRELGRFIHLKSLLLVHGNVLDMVSYQVQVDAHPAYWTEGNLGDFFQHLLLGLGYEVVGQFDPVDGLGFAGEAMERRFAELADDKGKGRDRREAMGGRGQTTTGLADPLPVVRDLARAMSNRETPCACVFNFASQLTASPDRLNRQEQGVFTRLLKASLESREVINEQGRWNNVIIMVCEKINDLPAFLVISGSGAATSILLHGIPEALMRLAWCAAVPGPTFGATRAPTSASTSARAAVTAVTAVTATSGFVWCVRPPSADHWTSVH